ncbi:MAG: SDR family NAD(P)-dependent oxidoreductase [Alphaproteobacteria bacterium]|jgi:3-oxoacyl-[acyl-carrier protein] reductase|nr:SDR family NAD(P)-dependent oxidoreductase [Alphaproteobacteria bacterium]
MGALDGKIALVSGAGKNIGRAIALHLARDGATVVVNGRSDSAAVDAVVAEINAQGGQARAEIADVGDETAVTAMMARIGALDILVCNAGLRRQTAFLEMSFAEWREILSVALDGAFLLARHAAPLMVARGGGAIVALSGISTHLGTPQRAHVSASKAGLEGLMRALAVELAPHGIRANSVAPGAVDTVRGASAGAMPQGLGRDSGIPLGRKASVDDIARMVRFLAGPEGGQITGQTLHVNGGAYLT